MNNSGIGGQAVLEGIMMRSASSQAVAVRKSDGSIQLKTKALQTPAWYAKVKKIPVVRGICAFLVSMLEGIRAVNDSASMLDDSDDTSGNEETSGDGSAANKGTGNGFGSVLTVLFAIALVILLFTVLPYRLSRMFESWGFGISAMNLIEGGIRILIFISYLTGVSLIKDIRRTYMYHGAEHKCINCLETGHDLTVDNVLAASRFHRRCSTSFLFVVVFLSVVLFLFIRSGNPAVQLLMRIALIPLISGISYEMLMYAASHDNTLARVLSSPGLLMQRLTTREPDSAMAEVAMQAVEAVFDWREYLGKNDQCQTAGSNGDSETEGGRR